MKQAVLKTYGKIIGAILSLIGFITGLISCNNEPGSPTATYIVAGNVTSAQGNSPINNIRIVVDKLNPLQAEDTVYTNASGVYEIKFQDVNDLSRTYNVIASDVDGYNNGGLFLPDTLQIQFTDKDKTSNGNGYNFKVYQKTGQNLTLKSSGVIALYGVMKASYKENGEK